MNIDTQELLTVVIKPTLRIIEPTYSQAQIAVAASLLLATAGSSEACKTEVSNTRADQTIETFGPFGIKALDHLSVWDHFLAFNEDLASKIRGLASQHRFLKNPNEELAGNLGYATAIAWSLYKQMGLGFDDISSDKACFSSTDTILNKQGAILAAIWAEYFPGQRSLEQQSKLAEQYVQMSQGEPPVNALLLQQLEQKALLRTIQRSYRKYTQVSKARIPAIDFPQLDGVAAHSLNASHPLSAA